MCPPQTFQWTPVGPAPVANPGPGQGGNAGRVNAAVADPTNPDVIYLAAAGGGIWKTVTATSGNAPTWQPLTDDQPSLQMGGVHSLSVHPADNKIVQGCAQNAGAGILRSEQAGASGSWGNTGASLFNQQGVNGIAAHPNDPKTTFAATGMGLYLSSDSGQTWTQVTGGLPNTGVSDVVFARFDTAVLFVTVFGNGGANANLNGIYRSVDGGSTWSILGSLPQESPHFDRHITAAWLAAPLGCFLLFITGHVTARGDPVDLP